MAAPNHLETLGRRLRALRVNAKLSGKELAAELGWPASKVSRIELARQNASPADVDAWITATRGGEAERSLLLGLLDQAREDQQTHRWRTRHGQAPHQAGYNALVQNSSLMREFHNVVVPGMLQTPDYARAILTASMRAHEVPVADVEEAVATRMKRQQYLRSKRRFEYVIAEPVLRWGLVPADVMRDQLERLFTVMRLRNVRVGILPYGVTDDVPTHMFEMFDDLVCVEIVSREHRYTGSEAADYARAFEALQRVALSGEAAREMLRTVAGEL